MNDTISNFSWIRPKPKIGLFRITNKQCFIVILFSKINNFIGYFTLVVSIIHKGSNIK